MKILLMFTALCYGALAQDINGVSLTGTPDNPMIVNNSSKAVIGWTVMRYDGDGNILPADRIVMAGELRDSPNPGVQPGETQTPQIHNTINFSSRGSAVRVELDSVLFADGEVAGPDMMASPDSPELGALAGFSHQLADIQKDWIAVPRIANVPHLWANSSKHNTIQAGSSKMVAHDYWGQPCDNAGACWPLVMYSGDQHTSGYIVGTPYGAETPAVGGTAVCDQSSPYPNYQVGDNVNATVFCPYVHYAGDSTEGTKRADFQADRIIQSYLLFNEFTGALQNQARFHELCAYATLPNRGGQGPFGKAVVEYNFSYGCP